MKKIILIAALLFSGAIFAFAGMNINVTFNNHTNESLTIAQGGSGWFVNNMPNTITVNPQSQSFSYVLTPLDNYHHCGHYDGVQGFNIYNSSQSQNTHLEIATALGPTEGNSISTSTFNYFGGFVQANQNSFQTIWTNYTYGLGPETYMIASLYNSNSNVPFIITNVITANESVTVNIYNPADIVPLTNVSNISFHASNYNLSGGENSNSTHNSGILVLDNWYNTGTIFVEQNGTFTQWGGSGQWPDATITGIPNYSFNSDGTLDSMTVNVTDGSSWTYANGQWSQN